MVAARKVRRHEGPGVLHLHAGLHWKTKEGLVRGCSCRGTAGFAHVSSWRSGQDFVAEAEENNLGPKVKEERWSGGTLQPVRAKIPRRRVRARSVGVLEGVLGRRRSGLGSAMTMLGNGLAAVKHTRMR